MWSISGAKACLEIDELLLPYFKVQARKVQLHAELCRRIVEYKPTSFDARILPAEEVRARQLLLYSLMGQ
jgi:hypothetical protein